MKETDIPPVFESVQQLHQHLNLIVNHIDSTAEFTISNLRDIHIDLPVTSPVFRANFFSFVFVKNGNGNYTSDNMWFPTSPGTIYFTNPGNNRSFEWHDLEDVTLITMSDSFLKKNVHPDIFDEFSFLLAESIPPKILCSSQFLEFEHLYVQILKEYTSTSPYRNKLIGNLFVIILLKIKEHFWLDYYNPICDGCRSSQIVKKFKIMLDKHYKDLNNGLIGQAYRVQDYADALNLHPNYLNNVIKSKTGKSIGDWITEKTIAKAKSLLQNSPVPIKELARRLGFNESNYFNSYFRKHTGITPGLYRKQHLHGSTS